MTATIIPNGTYNRRAYRLLVNLITNMYDDLFRRAGKHGPDYMKHPVIIHRAARRDLLSFHDWRVFQIAKDLGMEFPNEAQVKRVLDNKEKVHIKRWTKR